jgi:tetratricopeptide (TPR) repeat protein
MVLTAARRALLIAAAIVSTLISACRDGEPGTSRHPQQAAETVGGKTESPFPSKSDPPSEEAERADQLLYAGEWRKALDAYYKLPPTREVLKKRAFAHMQLWEIEPAIRILREAREQFPDDPEISGYLAAALTLNRELDEALSIYREVLEKLPANNNVRNGYALALAWSRDFDAAAEQYQRVLAGDPRHLEARLGLGDVLAWQKRYDEAAAEYGRVSAATADRRLKSDAFSRSARALAWKGDLPAALARYEEALAVNSRNAEALLGKGEVHEWLRQYGEAKAAYEEVLRVAPEHPAAKAKLLQLMWVK